MSARPKIVSLNEYREGKGKPLCEWHQFLMEDAELYAQTDEFKEYLKAVKSADNPEEVLIAAYIRGFDNGARMMLEDME